MEFTFWNDFFTYWQDKTPEQVIRTFWYFFVFEAPRFLFMDVVALFVVLFREHFANGRFQNARNAFLEEKPFLSVIVPGKNEGKHIFKLVNSLKQQTYQHFEIIIVDDGSTDNTHQICRSLQKSGLIRHYFHNGERGGKASAANLALRFARGKFIVHLDADSSFDPDAIERILIPFYEYDNVGAVGGNVKVRNFKTGLCARLQAIEYLNTISMGRLVTTMLGIYRVVSGAFGAFPKEVLDRLGGWDIGPGLDGDLTMKIRKLGYDIYFEHRAVCQTSAPVTFKALWKQRLRWSASIVRFRLRKHADVFMPNANFRFTNFLSSFDNIFFNIVLDFLWIYYFLELAISNYEYLAYVLPMNLILYAVASFFQLVMVLILSERRKSEVNFLLYVPLMVFYMGFYLRLNRTIAYIRELFFYTSYKDPWNPAKTSVQARANGL